MNALRRAAPLAAFILSLAGGAVQADDAADETPGVTPYRPTVSDPAALSAPGWLELEAGLLRVRDADGTRTLTAPYLFKYAFDADRGLLFGGDAWIDQAPHGASSVGDTFVAWKQRFVVSESAAFGIEAGVQAPSARDALGIGKPAYLLRGIYSVDFGATHLDLNAGGTRFTRRVVHASSWQSAWSAALSHPLNDALGAAAEISGDAQRGVGHQHQLLGAINYNLARRCVLDAGLAYGLDRSDHSHQVFFGATWLLGQLR